MTIHHPRLSMCIGLMVCILCASGAALHAQGTVNVWLEFGTRDTIFARVGDPVYFDVVVRNAQGDTIRNWDSVGQSIELHVTNSDAELDSSYFSWSSRPDNYTWLMITKDGTLLSSIGPQDFSISHHEFTDGVVRLGFFSTKAETGTRVEIGPFVDSVMSMSPPITRLPLAADNFLVEWTAQQEQEAGSTFFLKRPIEFFVTARDRFTNPVMDTINVGFMVNFPAEFSPAPGHAFPSFTSRQSIHGEQAFHFIPDTTRVRGETSGYVITSYCPDNYNIKGSCDSFFVAPHPPRSFALQSPAHNSELRFDRWDDTLHFVWEQPVPPDPYADIRVERDHVRTHSDTLTYRIHFVDADSPANEIVLASDHDGTEPSFTCSAQALAAITDSLSGILDVNRFDMLVFVEATDGVDTTCSTPVDTTHPGHRIRVVNDMADKGVALQFDSQDPIGRESGEAIRFDFVALDRDANVVADWNVVGRTIALRVLRSSAESDTSSRAWGSDPDGYSWARLEVAGTLIAPSMPGEYRIPKTLFVDGRASAIYTSSKAEDAVRLEIYPGKEGWKRISPQVTWSPAPLDNILVDISWPCPAREAVYFELPYGLSITARDRFLNPIEDEIELRIEVRFPDEIAVSGDSARPPLDTLLTLPLKNTVHLLSTVMRDDSTAEARLQKISAQAMADPSVRGEVPSYAVLAYAPFPFIPLTEQRVYTYARDDGISLRGARVTMTIGEARDTLGNAWYEFAWTDASCPAQGWYRSDAAGLHMLQDSAGVAIVDRLMLPSNCCPPEQFTGGDIIDTGYVWIGGVPRRTATIRYPGKGSWTWGEDIGLLMVEAGQRTYRLLETEGYVDPMHIVRPQEFIPPFGSNDLLVLRIRRREEWKRGWQNYILKTLEAGTRIRGSWWHQYMLLQTNSSIPTSGVRVQVNERNIVTWNGIDKGNSLELYPTYIPQDDEVLLNNIVWTVSRRFDTLMLGASCRAFELTRKLPSSSRPLHRRIITDRFGEVRANSDIGSNEEGECYLTSAVVRDTAYNRDTSRITYFDFCTGNRAQHRRSLDWREDIVWWEVTADSLMAGHTWHYMPGDMRNIYSQPLAGWLRWEMDGLHHYDPGRGYDSLLLSSTANIGDWCRWGIIYDTASVLDGNTSRRLLKTGFDMGFVADGSGGWNVHLLEGVGIRFAEWSGWDLIARHELLYAEICGRTWGIPLAVSSPPALPEGIDLQVYPNPARNMAHFTVRASAPVTATLYDLLGRNLRKIHTASDGQIVKGTFDLQGIQPGIYLITIRSRESVQTVKLVVVE